MTAERQQPIAAPRPPAAPRFVAVSGLLFSVLFSLGLVLIRMAVPADPNESGRWLADGRYRDSIRLALNLIPFTGIAFLWFMAALRSRIGLLEDRFFATVFLESGVLFVALLFASAAVAGATLETFAVEGRQAAQSETFAFGRRISYLLMNTFAMKMAAVFMFVTSSIGLRTDCLPRWMAFVGFATGLVLLLVVTDFAWVALLIPMWVLLVSTCILAADLRERSLASSTLNCRT